MDTGKEKLEQSTIADRNLSGRAKKIRLPREPTIILGAATILILGTALLLIPVFGWPKAFGEYRSRLSAAFYDPVLPTPAAILDSLAKSEAIRPEAAAAAAKASTALAVDPDIRFERGDGLLVVTARAGTKAGAAAAARAVFDYVVAAYSVHPARQAAFSAYMAARDVGNIRIFGRALAEQALAQIPVAVTILDDETVGVSSGLAVIGIALFTACAGLALTYFGKKGRRGYPESSSPTENSA